MKTFTIEYRVDYRTEEGDLTSVESFVDHIARRDVTSIREAVDFIYDLYGDENWYRKGSRCAFYDRYVRMWTVFDIDPDTRLPEGDVDYYGYADQLIEGEAS